jgi:lipopolysaccharide export system protein LptC
MEQERAPAQAADAVARDPRARAYARAKRHSRTVRFFKVAIPAGAALAIGTVVAIAVFDPFGRMGGLSLGPIQISGSKLTMENPRMTGFRKDNRGYEVTATTATQDVRKPTVVELKDMRVRLVMDNSGALARVAADFGVFDTVKEYLEMRQNVAVKTDNGQEVYLKSAAVDLKGGTVRSREPVAVKFPGGTVDADAFEVQDNGKVMTFTGRVRTFLAGGPGEGKRGTPTAQDQEVAAPPPEKVAQGGRPDPEPMSLRR